MLSIQKPSDGTNQRRGSMLVPGQKNKVAPRRGSMLYHNDLAGRGSFMPGRDMSMKKRDILTGDQKKAFREVFDLFDSNGGGTIDAQELDEALRSAGIHLTKEEITDVLTSMDKDGNGEIDFEEFLQLMTNTERFLESVMLCTDQERKQREVLLFDALTEFMKKSALHSINEIVGYYHSKYKKVQTPHVIRHYADGARLIGLSEQQIRRHLDRLRESSVDNKSPYAQPPYAFYSNIDNKKKTKEKKLPAITEEPNSLEPNTQIPDKLNILVPESGRGKIRLKFILGSDKQERKLQKSENARGTQQSAVSHTVRNETKEKKKYNGWIAQRCTSTTVRLPALTAQIDQEKLMFEEFSKRGMLNFDDMNALRHRVSDLVKGYYKRIQSEKCEEAARHWHALAVEEIPTSGMRHAYTRVFKAYADYRSTPVQSLCSRSLA